MKQKVIVIGAGASGLMAARQLSKAGKQVVLLEARERIGGRIHTLHNESFFQYTELGAEFVHGDLPLTLGLLNKAGIASHTVNMQMWRCRDGRFVPEEEQVEHWDKVMEKLDQLEADMPIAEFLDTHFGDKKYAAVTQSVLRFVAGYDTADARQASSFALRQEWQHEDDGAQHRLNNGYGELMDYLADDIKSHGGGVELSTVVKQIAYDNKQVQVTTTNRLLFKADKVIIALPLGVLQQGGISFNPKPAAHLNAFQQIGFGNIIKILVRFDAPFWEDEGIIDTAFLFSDERIPTWWTQRQGSPVLTGWLGGPPALALKDTPDDEVWLLALKSLAWLFGLTTDVIKDRVVAWHVVNWTADPFTQGSYAYDMVGSDKARAILNEPINSAIYFAGEYLYDGPAMGTVEAALNSGLQTANKLIAD